MKLYIWSYDVNYYGTVGVIFAAANSLQEARKAIANGKAFCGSMEWTHWEKPNADADAPSTGHQAKIIGKPDRIINLDQPYAEWHEWSE